MKILHLSDTHNRHQALGKLPEADVVVHSGDFSDGTEDTTIGFLNWFCDLPHPHKIFICGNHDIFLYQAKIDGLDPNVHYLCHSGVVIDGLKFYGVPLFMEDRRTDRQHRNIAKIPTDTDVLITHSPAYGILDFDNNINYGDETLLIKVMEIQPRLHLFGHIHAGHGITTEHGITFSNGSIVNSEYTALFQPHLIEI